MAVTRSTQYEVFTDASQSKAEWEQLGATASKTEETIVKGASASAAAMTATERAAASAGTQHALLTQKAATLRQEVDRLAKSLTLELLNLKEAASEGNAVGYEAIRAKVSALTAQLNEMTAQLEATKAALASPVAPTRDLANSFGTLRVAGLAAGGEIGRLGRGLAILGPLVGGLNPLLLLGTFIIGALIAKLIEWSAAKEVNIKAAGDLLIAETALTLQQGDSVRMGNLVSASTRNQALTGAALVAVIAPLTEHQKKLTEVQDKVSNAQMELTKLTADYKAEVKGTGENLVEFSDTSKSVQSVQKEWQDIITGSTDDLTKHSKAVEEGVAKLNEFKAITGGSNAALIEFAKSAGFTAEAVKNLTDALNSDSRAMAELASKAKDASVQVRSLQEAETALNLQRSGIKAPDFDIGHGKAGDDLKKFSDNLVTNLTVAEKAYGSLGQAVIVNKKNLEEYKKAMEENSVAVAGAKGGVTEFHREMAQQPLLLQQAIDKVKEIDDGMKKFTEHHKSGAGAARALAQAENTLTKELREAQAALEADSFTAREAKLKADIESEEKRFMIAHKMRRLNQEDQATFDAIYRARLEKLDRDREMAEQAIQDRIAAIQVEAIANDLEREKAKLVLEAQRAFDQEVKSGVDAVKAQEHANAMLLGLQNELARKTTKIWDDYWAHFLKEAEKTDKIIEVEEAARDRQTLARVVSQLNTILVLRRQFGRGESGFMTQTELDRLKNAVVILSLMNGSVKELDVKFGGAARTLNVFVGRVQATAAEANKHPLKAFIEDLKQLEEEQHKSITITHAWALVTKQLIEQMGSEIENVFSAMIQGQLSFSQAMKKMVLDLIATVAEYWGMYFIAQSIPHLLTPGMQAQGAAELAGGLALMALAGILKGVAGGIGSSSGTGAAAAASSGGGSASSGGGSGLPRPPTIIPFPTTPPNQQATHITVINTLDRRASGDFLKGQKVITQHSLARGGDRAVLKRSLRGNLTQY